MNYRIEIDGLRAIAVLSVIVFHAGFSTFRGGYVGVDIFFVISGYLITTIILEDVENGTFSFLKFYERRARRILAPLFLVILCTTPFAYMWMLPLELKAFSASIVSVCVFLSNILFWRQSGYFDASAEQKPLLHTWSLAVEEQFYIIFPFAILLMSKLCRSVMIWGIVLIALASLGLSEYASRYHPWFNFYWLPTRAWEFMIGALCPFIHLKAGQIRDNLLSIAGLIAICSSIWLFDESIPFPSLYAALPVLGTSAIILFAREGTITYSILSLKPIVGIGLVSYSAYLWHQPLFALARIRSLTQPTPQIMLFLVVLSLVLAYACWRFVETPVRRTQASILTASSIGVSIFLGLGTTGYIAEGFPARGFGEALTLSQFSGDQNPRTKCISGPNEIIPIRNSCVYGNEQRIKVALIGDSHAHALAYQLGVEFSALSVGLREFTHSGCPPIYGYRWTAEDGLHDCDKFHKEIVAYIRSAPEIEIIVLWTRWPLYVEFDRYDNGEGGIEAGKIAVPEIGLFEAVNREEIKRKIGNLYLDSINEMLNLDKKVVLIYPQPEVGWDVPQYLSKAIAFGVNITRPLTTSFEQFKKRTQFVSDELDKAESEYLARVYPARIFCDTFVANRCAAEDGKTPFYSDNNHVNNIGAALVAREVIKSMQKKGWLETTVHDLKSNKEN